MPQLQSARYDIFRRSGGVFQIRNAPLRKWNLLSAGVSCVNSMPFYGWPAESLQIRSVSRTVSSLTFRGRPLFHCRTHIETFDPKFAVAIDPGTLGEMQIFRMTPIVINCDFNRLPLGVPLFQ